MKRLAPLLVATALVPAVLPARAAAQPDAGPPAADAGRARDAGPADAGRPDAQADAGPPAVEEEPLPEEARPRLSIEVTPTSGVMTGDVVTLTIRADAREGDDVAMPTQELGSFEVRDTHARVLPAEGGRHTFELKVELLALAPGDQTVGPIQLRVVTEDGLIGTVSTDPIPVQVGSILGNEPDAQPKPQSDPVDVMEDDYTLLWIGGGLLLMLVTALITLLVARWWKRRPRPAPPPPPPRPPWELALARLDKLRRERPGMMSEGRGMEWIDSLSDTLRDYLGGRFGFDGLESTTDEVLSRMKRLDVPAGALAEVTTVLGECDLVKFAKAPLDEDDCDPMLEKAVNIVHTTTPPRDFGAPASPGGA